MKKIGIMHYTGPGRGVGGVEVVIGDHTHLLNNIGHEVHLIFGEGGGLKGKKILNHRIKLLSTSDPSIKKVQSEILKKYEETQSFKILKKKIEE